MTNLVEFYQEFVSDIQNDADAKGILQAEAFFDKVSEILAETGEVDTADRCYYESKAGSSILQVDGYGGDPRDSEGILSLIICDFQIDDEPTGLVSEDIKRIFKRLVNFLSNSLRSEFRHSLEETSPAFQLADLIASTWSSISKVKLILLTNRPNNSKVDAVPAGELNGVPLTYNIWDLSRIHRVIASGRSREDLVVNFAQDFGGAIPVLKASGDSSFLSSYIAVIPGAQLAEIYERWGTRLLESNVRSFLQARGKVNKGIRDTIQNDPKMFFSYNNGITATAEAVEIESSQSGLVLTSAYNLQIVNGGQTTASIHAARKTASSQLNDVFVQMKLSVISPDNSEELVPKISEFANSQNKVNAADFFSNHPFHIRMEGYSRRMLAPAGDNEYRE